MSGILIAGNRSATHILSSDRQEVTVLTENTQHRKRSHPNNYNQQHDNKISINMKYTTIIVVGFFSCLVHTVSGQRRTFSSKCRDQLDSYSCHNWRSQGICHDPSYRYLMLDKCRKTCRLCTATSWATDASKKCVDKKGRTGIFFCTDIPTG